MAKNVQNWQQKMQAEQLLLQQPGFVSDMNAMSAADAVKLALHSAAYGPIQEKVVQREDVTPDVIQRVMQQQSPETHKAMTGLFAVTQAITDAKLQQAVQSDSPLAASGLNSLDASLAPILQEQRKAQVLQVEQEQQNQVQRDTESSGMRLKRS